MVGDHESDAVLDFLHQCSQQLLEANIDSSGPQGSDTQSDEQSVDVSQLEAIQDLILFENSSNGSLDSKPVSPVSCDTDMGYESANSPTNAFENSSHIDDNEWKQTLCELFPDLV